MNLFKIKTGAENIVGWMSYEKTRLVVDFLLVGIVHLMCYYDLSQAIFSTHLSQWIFLTVVCLLAGLLNGVSIQALKRMREAYWELCDEDYLEDCPSIVYDEIKSATKYPFYLVTLLIFIDVALLLAYGEAMWGILFGLVIITWKVCISAVLQRTKSKYLTNLQRMKTD